jgi:hypothetical protein
MEDPAIDGAPEEGKSEARGVGPIEPPIEAPGVGAELLPPAATEPAMDGAELLPPAATEPAMDGAELLPPAATEPAMDGAELLPPAATEPAMDGAELLPPATEPAIDGAELLPPTEAAPEAFNETTEAGMEALRDKVPEMVMEREMDWVKLDLLMVPDKELVLDVELFCAVVVATKKSTTRAKLRRFLSIFFFRRKKGIKNWLAGKGV